MMVTWLQIFCDETCGEPLSVKLKKLQDYGTFCFKVTAKNRGYKGIDLYSRKIELR